MEHIPLMARFNEWVNGRLYGAVAELPESAHHADEGLFFDGIAWAPQARTDETGQAVVDAPRPPHCTVNGRVRFSPAMLMPRCNVRWDPAIWRGWQPGAFRRRQKIIPLWL